MQGSPGHPEFRQVPCRAPRCAATGAAPSPEGPNLIQHHSEQRWPAATPLTRSNTTAGKRPGWGYICRSQRNVAFLFF